MSSCCSTSVRPSSARRRLLRDRRPEPPTQSSSRHALGELIFDESTQTAKHQGRPLTLTRHESALLRVLTQQPGRVFTRPELLQQIWG